MTIFHGKYIENFNNYLQNFPENAVEKAINTIKLLLDPHAEISVNKKLVFKVEEIRSLIHDSFIPHIRFVFCNNGLFWNDLAQKRIDSFLSKFPDRAEFIHFNHESIIKILHRSKKVDTYLKLS
ncbi:MAG: abortive phage resistance protein, partial [Desulfovibrionaceae bacterium]|nr:abortive phage resistance protein [Desulfovibrionaceae bacterium]